MNSSAGRDSECVGGFQRLQVIGAGAQAKVWKAKCVEDVHGIVPVGTVVALKVKYEHGDSLDAQWQKTEARIGELKTMDHPNVVRYLGCFREKALDQEKHVVVQEFLEGETLKERLEGLNRWNPGKNRLGLDVDASVDVISQVAAGLGYTAGLGIFHRDVKPGNIFLCKDGTVKLIDFGVARQSDGTITEEGNIRGSWNYLAPDFADGVFRGDQQSDIFSVGVVLHEIITGRLPYRDVCGDDTAAYFARWAKKSEDSPIRIVSNTRRLLMGIDGIFDKTLTPDRDRRYADFFQLKKALEGIRFVEQRHGDKTFRRLQFIGEGGFGEVFKARWLERNVPVAVKMLKNTDDARRFHAEARVMQELDDPCFTRFIDFFEEDGRSFLVMSFLDDMPGSSLRDAISRSKIEAKLRNEAQTGGGLPKDLVLSAFERYARGLGLMHRHLPMIVHRDIKPSNLYYPVGHPERVAIMDFGIVRTGDDRTANGLTPCTFDYAPPEIITTLDRGGPGMDVFALGLCLYEALTGKTGYPRISGGQSGMLQFFERCRERKAPVFDDPRVVGDPDLLRLLRRMTDPDVTRRLTSADEVAVEIRKLFYRDVESETSETTFFDPNTDRTVAISDDRLLAWFDAWKRANPVDEKRLMEMYREQWLKEHEGNESQAVRELPRSSRWKTPLLLLATVTTTAAAVIFVWPYVGRIVHPSSAPVPDNPIHSSTGSPGPDAVATSNKLVQAQLMKAQLDIERMTFVQKFNEKLIKEPVESRRRRLAAAEALLKRVVGPRTDLASGVLYEEGSDEAKRFDSQLRRQLELSVGMVDNRCDGKVEVDGRIVHEGTTERLEFGIGDSTVRKIVLAGYEPKALPADFDGKTLVLTNGDFVPEVVRVDLPADIDDSIVCLFEDEPVRGPLKLKPRQEHYLCVFRKRGHDDKVLKFQVQLGKAMRLEKLGEWKVSPVEVTIGDLEAGIICELDGKPASKKVLLGPGNHTVKYLRRGYVDLVAHFKVEIGAGGKVPAPSEAGPWKMSPVRVSVPYLEPGTRCLIDGQEEVRRYRDLMPGEHAFQYERAGYVTQSNRTFVVALATPTNLPAPARWVAENVRVTIPKLSGVDARLAGKSVSGQLSLPPNKLYALKYTERATGRHQTVQFFVQVNAPMEATGPDPNNWIDPRPAVPPPQTNSPPIPKPAPKPDPVPANVSEQAQGEYKTAVEYYEFEDYAEAFDHYHNAFKAGYPFNAQDLRNIEKSFTAAHKQLKAIQDTWSIRPGHKDSHRKIDELTKQLSDLNRKYREIKKAYGL